jgi:predicted transposase YbfD/YdcC
MNKRKLRDLSAEEQHILDHGHLRLLISVKDIARCNEAIGTHHYLHNATLVGEHLRYAFIHKGKWLAVAAWSSAAFHLKARDAFIGWTGEQCRCRRSLIANNSRLLVLPDCHYPNLISRFMKLMLAQLSADWQQRWGHPIALVETFVDPSLYQGTAYKVSGWSHLGRTAGWKRDADDFYQKHDAPKQIWIRELVKKACAKLRAPKLPSQWAHVEAAVFPRCHAKVIQISSLMEKVRAEIAEFRRAEALGYPIAGMICLLVMAAAQGVCRGPQDLEDYADTLTQGQLRALRFRRDAESGKIRSPKRTTFSRVLHQVDDDLLERVLLRWQDQVLGPSQDRIVIIDGKSLRHAGVEIVNAVNSTGRFLGSVITQSKSNEIPAGRQLLLKEDLLGKIIVADALHTQDETARQILHDQGGDYLVTVKGNQLTIQKTLESLFAKQVFSPSPHDADPSAQTGTQSRAIGDSFAGVHGSHSQSGGLSWSATGSHAGVADQTQRQMVPKGGLFVEQLNA